MQRRLTVIPSRRGDNIITIQYRSFSPAEAAAVANAFAKHYADAAIEMKVEPARQYARWFGEQNKKLRAELEAAQARLSAFQRDKGIGVKDENLHAETERLASLAAQLTAVQSEGGRREEQAAHRRRRAARGDAERGDPGPARRHPAPGGEAARRRGQPRRRTTRSTARCRPSSPS